MKTKRANLYLLYTLTAFSLLNFACGTANDQAIVLPVPPPTAQEHQRLQSSSPQRSRPDQASSAPAPLVIEEQAGIPYCETVLTIPVGEAGVAYRGVDTPGMEITGPNALAILSDSSMVVADLVGNRLLRYAPKGNLINIIDLYTKEIINIWDLVAFKDELILLEISLDVSPERHRVNRLTSNGKLLTSYDLPKGYRLQDGLTGISVDCEGQILLEIKGGQEFYRLIDSTGTPYLCNGKPYRVESTKLVADDVELETQLTAGFGGLKLLGVLADGSIYVVREDVVAQQPVITVDQTVHYMSADGLQLGVARVPIAEAYYYVMRNLAVGPDGYVYALLPRPDAVHIVRLKLFRSIAPLVPNAVAPLVTRSSARP